jgi:methylamine dehydrogenase light chain
LATSRIDRFSERLTRRLACGTSRRSLLSRLGAFAVAAPLIPLLPVSRANAETATAFTRNAQTKDDKKCDYWRYCAIDGALCSCCGGGVHTCPAGTTPSPTAWVGTCVNPDDHRSYLIAYRDCCGAAACSRCNCDATDRETPSYRPQTDNNIIWCIGLSTMQYHCSTAVLVGVAE